MNYQEFKKNFERSGLTQRAYGEQISMSSSMVSYYLRKAREEVGSEEVGRFQEVTISEDVLPSRQIKIITPDGLEINIPL